MKVLVTGACGMLGVRLVKDLLHGGHIVNGLDSKSSGISHENYSHDIIDISDQHKFMSYLEGLSIEAIIHLAARTDLEGMVVSDYAVNFLPIITINNYITDHDIKRVIFTSTQLVHHLHRSNDSECPPNAYGESKLIAEKIIEKFNDKRYLVLRPTTIWGEGHNFHYCKFISYLKKRLYFHPTRKPLFKSYSYIGNASFQIMKLLDAREADLHNIKLFYLCDYSPIDLITHINKLAYGLNIKPPITLPRRVAMVIAKIGDVLGFFCVKVPFNTFRMNNIETEYQYNTDALKKITGDLPFDHDGALTEFICWLKKQN